MPNLPSFLDAYPEVSVDLALTEMPDNMPANSVDLVIRLGLPGEKSVVGHRLAQARRILCGSPSPTVPGMVLRKLFRSLTGST